MFGTKTPQNLSVRQIGEALVGPEAQTLDFTTGLYAAKKALELDPDVSVSDIVTETIEASAHPVADSHVAGIVVGALLIRKAGVEA